MLVDLLILSVLATRCLSAPTARTDIIFQNQSISDGQTLVSMGKEFVLGFFSPGASSNRYVGIWHNNVSERRAVWVANRNNPFQDTSGILKFDNSSNLIVLDGRSVGVMTPDTHRVVHGPSRQERPNPQRLRMDRATSGGLAYKTTPREARHGSTCLARLREDPR